MLSQSLPQESVSLVSQVTTGVSAQGQDFGAQTVRQVKTLLAGCLYQHQETYSLSQIDKEKYSYLIIKIKQIIII